MLLFTGRSYTDQARGKYSAWLYFPLLKIVKVNIINSNEWVIEFGQNRNFLLFWTKGLLFLGHLIIQLSNHLIISKTFIHLIHTSDFWFRTCMRVKFAPKYATSEDSFIFVETLWQVSIFVTKLWYCQEKNFLWSFLQSEPTWMAVHEAIND